ncbi:hypothetical protein AOZ06_27945 [Kibdelosporangium phytohabitans]|uniref:tRNA-guanine(15) transglycosylase-like domain-containing protein n=1 Tax=Kibdelosporangium phytohabitans TaxID=860235 RepID=A0A0N9I2F9_9PSEU|nr:hypothetical protein AOZ06_27945 [Kibdelosporangium phytohabitans]
MVGALLNRVLVHATPAQAVALQPYVSAEHGGFVLTGAQGRFHPDCPVLVDPAAYERHVATPDAPFLLPTGGLLSIGLPEMLDDQLAAGATAAITPTKFIAAGDIGSLTAAARQVARLDRQDVLFLVPLDISLLGRAHFDEVTAILADAGHPVALVLGRRFGSLAQTADRVVPYIRNLRVLAAAIDLMPLRTDFTAFDLVAHGAFAGAPRSGGAVRHTGDSAPDVLVPGFMAWWRGSDLADLFGARQNLAPRCPCVVCDEQRLTRLIRAHHAEEAMCHAVATWSAYAGDLLGQPTMRARAEYWRRMCGNAIGYHSELTHHLRRVRPLVPRKSIQTWATLSPWT